MQKNDLEYSGLSIQGNDLRRYSMKNGQLPVLAVRSFQIYEPGATLTTTEQNYSHSR